MNRLAAILIVTVASLALAQDAAVQMPPLIEQADARYEKAVAEANAIRMKVYEKAIADATRRGDLATATAIKKRMEDAAALSANDKRPPSLAGTEWIQVHQDGRVWRVHFQANGVAAGGWNTASRPWKVSGSALQFGNGIYRWDGRSFIGTDDASSVSIVPWPWSN